MLSYRTLRIMTPPSNPEPSNLTSAEPISAKRRVTSAEAQVRLIDAVIGLLDTVPFTKITARRIGEEVQMDPNVIFRNFDDVEGLFVAVLRELEQRIIANVSTVAGPPRAPMRVSTLWIRFSLWLALSGVAVERLQPDPAVVASLRENTLRRFAIDPESSERAQSALFAITMAMIQTQVMFTQIASDLFTPDTLRDVAVLINALADQLPEMSNLLDAADQTSEESG